MSDKSARLGVILLMSHLGAASAAQVELDYSALIGGSGFDRAQYVYLDQNGFIYVVGNTSSTNFPTTAGAFDRTYNGGTQDAFVAKLTPDGQNLIWSTLLGGSFRDQAYAIRVDSQGFLYVVGSTGSSNFPVTAGAADTRFDGGSQGSNGYGDAFAVKLTPDASALVYSTFVGGPGGEEENPRAAMHVDSSGNLFMAGYTQSTSFPTTIGGYQRSYGGGPGDGFVVKLSADGSTFLSGTYFGGSGDEWILEDIAALPDGRIVVGGATTSTNLPPTPAANPGVQMNFAGPGGPRFYNGGDAFVATFSEDLSSLNYFTYLGGAEHDDGGAIVVDGAGRVVVNVNTFSASIANLSVGDCGFDNTNDGNRDGFIAMLSADGSRIEACSFLGGSGLEEFTRTRVGTDGFIYITGNTKSGNWPVTPDAYQSNALAGADAFLAVLSPDMSTLMYSTYLAGGGDDRGRGLWLGTSGQVMLSGDTRSANFPTTMPAFGSPNGDGSEMDAFLMRLTVDFGASLAAPRNLRIR